MGYFPFFIDITGKKCVIAGGGKVAQRKIEKLMPYKPDITVIAPEISEEIINNTSVRKIYRCFEKSDVDGAFMVIGATGDEILNREIYEICTEHRILVNTVDNPENCGFIFPALVNKGDVTVGITTSGKCPSYARFMREQIESLIDERYTRAAEITADIRPLILEMFPTENKRREVAETVIDLCVNSDKTYSEIIQIIEEMRIADENQNRNKG